MQILKDEIKNRIIEAATEVFFDTGFIQASTRRIIEKAGVSKGNLYNYFQSKEELFYNIVAPVFNYMRYVLEETFGHGDSETFNPSEINLLANKLCELLSDYRRQFIILLSKSQGTKYEDCKDMLINKLSEHFLKNFKPESDKEKLQILMKVAAMNTVNALLEIARNYKDDQWAKSNVELLMKYHLSGITQFY
ncbi:MAG: TetR/AcrR family transcriptional regulator [Bacillota bacterium]|nr:TetR/AcrR family transcriptional regulator [Bacillota bacterium]